MPSKRTKQPAPATEERRPDPLFKKFMTDAALQARLEKGPTELQVAQTTSSDMLLTIPKGAAVADTLFDFFRPTNVIEFKSASDSLNQHSFGVQLARVYLYLDQNRAVKHRQILNVIVSARFPREFFKFSVSEGITFEPDRQREWLYRARVGYQEVVVVVCEQLPLDLRYGIWLIFAAPTTQKWRDFLKLAAREHNWTLLEAARDMRDMRPKEFNAMNQELKAIFEEYGPKEQARLRADWWEVIKDRLPGMSNEEPEELTKLLTEFKPEVLGNALSNLSPEKLGNALSSLSPVEKAKLIKLLSEETPPKDN